MKIMKSIAQKINESKIDSQHVFDICMFFDNDRKCYDWIMSIVTALKKKPIDDISFEHFVNSSVLDKKIADIVKGYNNYTGESVRLDTASKNELKKYLTAIIFNNFEDNVGDIPNWNDDERYNYIEINW